MARSYDSFTITDETNVRVRDGELGIREARILNNLGILYVGDNNENGVVEDIDLDFSRLGRVAYEYELLDMVASQIEVEILDVFEEASESVLTTKQVVERTGRPTSSVSRALGRLADTRWLTKVQDGVYRFEQ